MTHEPNSHYSCLLVYYTPGGYRRQAWFKTIAPDPTAAATIAERLLRKDKRRAVARVSYWETIQGALA